MYTEKDFKNEFNKCLPKYFKQNFEGKPLCKAIEDAYKKELLELGRIYTKFVMLQITLMTIKNEDKDIPPNLGSLLDTYLDDVSLICQKLNDILKPIFAD